MATAAPASFVKEELPPPLTATSSPPPLFDGTTRKADPVFLIEWSGSVAAPISKCFNVCRTDLEVLRCFLIVGSRKAGLYISYVCPYAQRCWTVRNYKGLQDKIKLVPIDLADRPTWYKEKVYPENKVPSLEHNNEVKGESLDLIKYIDTHFEGPKLLPDDPAKRAFAEELLAYSDSFNKAAYSSLLAKGDDITDAAAALDKLEESLSKFEDGPFFLGHDFSLVDIAYAPFIERLQIFFSDVKKYDITTGRPKLTAWIEELNKIEAYTSTKWDPQELLAGTKKRLGLA